MIPKHSKRLYRIQKNFFGLSQESLKGTVRAVNLNFEHAAVLCTNLLYHFSYQTCIIVEHRIDF